MHHTQNYIPRGLLAATVVLFTAFQFGCTGPRAIKTKLDVSEASQMGGFPPFEYSSEKDVIISKRSTDPSTGIVNEFNFQALASAAAYAQAQREIVDAQVRVANAEAMRDTATAISSYAAAILNPMPTAAEAPRRVVTLPERIPAVPPTE